jgi:hypothetical protein
MMFVGYVDGHTGNCFRMYNPVTAQVCEMRDIIWCGRMYFTTGNCGRTKLLPVIAVPITNDVSNEDLAVIEVMKVRFSDSIGGEGTATGKKDPRFS